MMPCGCLVEQESTIVIGEAPRSDRTLRVIYCSTHEAAFRMDEALTAIIYASDQCTGHRECGHHMGAWRKAREIVETLHP